jgi:hypothetical protein
MAMEQHSPTRAEEILAATDVPRDLLIGGRWTPSADGGRLPVVDPSTGRAVTDVAAAGERDGTRRSGPAALPSTRGRGAG